ncbi:hypothetical protein Taro_014776 [Colocasia esculenta]|uniref:Uncharacterized protein n=1 Tax=Colocasia esculenta TaxID=4460 RepID=A0A843UFS1_COLES|nr:hypothetical protein [Colocasia esculenta]
MWESMERGDLPRS